MDNLETTAVNSAPSTESASTASASVETPVTGNASAETVNTESPVENQTIPYARFKEVNDKMNEYKRTHEQFKDFSGYDTNSLKAIADFNQMLSSNPDLYTQIEEVVKNFQEQQNPETALDPVAAKIKMLEKQLSEMQGTVTQSVQEKVLQNYDNDFNTLVSKDFKTPSEKMLVGHFTELAMGLKNNGYKNSYNQNLMKESYNEAKELATKVRNEIIEEYLKSQNDIKAPVNNGGMQGQPEVDVTNDGARMDFLKKALDGLKNKF